MEDLLQHVKMVLERDGVLYLNIKVIPKAQRTELVEKMIGPEGEEIWKVKVAAVPEKGKANKELCRFLAEQFGVPKNNVAVVQGQSSPRKVVKILGRSALL